MRITQADGHNSPMSVGKNIRARRQARGWKILDLAARIDSDVGNLSRLERGKQGYSQETLQNIASALECSVADLFTPPDQSGGNQPQAARISGLRKIWVIGNGNGGLPDRIWTDGDYPVGASDKFAEVATGDQHAFVVSVRGDSMWPKYKQGDFALVEPSEVPEIEDDVLVRLATGETMIKRLLSRRGGIRLGSYNSQEVMTFSEEEITWIYYVAHPIPARKIKHWVEAPEYAGEERRHKTEPHEPERRSGYVLPKPQSEMEHAYGRNLAPGERATPAKGKRVKSK